MSVKWKEYKKNREIRPVFENGLIHHWEARLIHVVATVTAPTPDSCCAYLTETVLEMENDRQISRT